MVLVYDKVWWDNSFGSTYHTILPPSDGSPLLSGTLPQALAFQTSPGTTSTLCLFTGGSLADKLESMTETEIVAWAHQLLTSSLVPLTSAPSKPESYHVTRWRSDPFCRGTYSYIPPDPSSPLDFVELSRPIWNERLGFAGEHTEPDLFVSFDLIM